MAGQQTAEVPDASAVPARRARASIVVPAVLAVAAGGLIVAAVGLRLSLAPPMWMSQLVDGPAAAEQARRVLGNSQVTSMLGTAMFNVAVVWTLATAGLLVVLRRMPARSARVWVAAFALAAGALLGVAWPAVMRWSLLGPVAVSALMSLGVLLVAAVVALATSAGFRAAVAGIARKRRLVAVCATVGFLLTLVMFVVPPIAVYGQLACVELSCVLGH